MAELKETLSGNIVDFSGERNEEFMENVALCDEELLEQFLESGALDESLVPGLIRERKLYPCFFGSALKMQGVSEFLDGLKTYVESPEYGEELGVRVFKIARDDQGNRLTHVKVTGGVLRGRMELTGADGSWQEKIHQIRVYSGSRYETVSEAPAGMVCALTGLTETFPGEGLGIETVKNKPVLEPVLNYRIQLPEGVDAAAVLPKFRLLEEEEPELHLAWNEQLQEIEAQVMGEVQVEILQQRIKERFDLDVSFGTGNIVYKETIANAVEGVGHFEPLRHYAEVHLWMEPGEPGSGVQAKSVCSEDWLDRNWQRLILTHVMEKEHRGVLTGAPLTDVKITLIAGRAHLKHTEGGDFRQAVYRAVRQGLMQAESVLLEPFYEFTLEVPETAVGRAMTDLEQMGAVFELKQDVSMKSLSSMNQNASMNSLSSMNPKGSLLCGQGPVSTMQNYARELAAYTRGEGRLVCVPAGYRPCHNADEVIAQIGYEPERDLENTADSVFCAHGAGFTVNWREAPGYMHIQTGAGKKPDEDSDLSDAEETPSGGSADEEFIDIEEIDEILMRTSHANRKPEPISHKGISGKKARSLTAKPVGLAKPRKGGYSSGRERYLLVDGYNIIFSWPELNELAKTGIDAARGRLMDILCNYQGLKKCHLILVFDAYRVQKHPTEVIQYHNITVVYTKEAETADQYIEKFAQEKGKDYHVTVATSDGLEQIIIRGAGCRLMSARDLESDVKRAAEEAREYMSDSTGGGY